MTDIIDFSKSLDTALLAGKCVLITGSASGLGALTAAKLAGYG